MLFLLRFSKSSFAALQCDWSNDWNIEDWIFWVLSFFLSISIKFKLLYWHDMTDRQISMFRHKTQKASFSPSLSYAVALSLLLIFSISCSHFVFFISLCLFHFVSLFTCRSLTSSLFIYISLFSHLSLPLAGFIGEKHTEFILPYVPIAYTYTVHITERHKQILKGVSITGNLQC